ncbi:MAG: adenosylcobinamide-GDP ribazoletransferase [Abditibacteriota bacterium]|nr:adenosylcobinamide-GDP ribazoletransferase [Abditibacteriota bacterium]
MKPKEVLYSFITAFSTWSRVPMPQIPWKQDNMKYALCFFPLVGALAGGLFLLAARAISLAPVSPYFRGVLLALVPALVTGGIHLDGFCDTADALSSHRDRETRLRILKDPHAGAFAVICFVFAELLYAGLLGSTGPRGLTLCAIGFVLSRSLGGAALLLFPPATPHGMAALCRQGADRQISLFVLLAFIVFSFAAAAYVSPVGEGAVVLLCVALLVWFHVTCRKAFGGITGDTIGFLITVTEILVAAAAFFI